MPGLTLDARSGMVDITLHDLHRMEGGPAQVLALSADALFEHLVELETSSNDVPLSMSGLAGDRQLRYEFVPTPELVSRHFESATAELAYV